MSTAKSEGCVMAHACVIARCAQDAWDVWDSFECGREAGSPSEADFRLPARYETGVVNWKVPGTLCALDQKEMREAQAGRRQGVNVGSRVSWRHT